LTHNKFEFHLYFFMIQLQQMLADFVPKILL
jgi:hypothetical protein